MLRGYLDRATDPEDRRRLRVTLTERGSATAGVIREAVETLDRALAARVGHDYVAHTRTTLASLISDTFFDA